MSRILVTGASGFVGHRVSALLAKAGHEVHGVSRTGAPMPQAQSHAADLLDDPTSVVAAVRPDVLVHLAWVTEHGAFWTAPQNLDWVGASLAMIRCFAAGGGRRVVVAGTCAEYDWQTGAGVLTEDAPLRPATLYGAAKVGLYEVAASYLAQESVELAWGRVFFPYGPDEQAGRLVRSVARALLDGQKAETTAGMQVRDFIHVDDVAGAFAALATSGVCGPINIGSGEATEVRALVGLIGDAVGRPDLLALGALPARADDPRAVVADVARLQGEVGFRAGTDLAIGIAAVVESLRAEAPGGEGYGGQPPAPSVSADG